MALSPGEFKQRFLDELLHLHWKHWSALGVAAHAEAEEHFAVDIEALIVSTLVVGGHDQRLLGVAEAWIGQNGELVNGARLRRVRDAFMRGASGQFRTIVPPWERLERFLKRSPAESHEENTRLNEKMTNTRPEEVLTELSSSRPALLQLALRDILGVGAAVEVMLYLLLNKSGNSNAIAKEICHDQKNVHRILNNWVRAGIVAKVDMNRADLYSLKREGHWFIFLKMVRNPVYVNWVTTFAVLDRFLRPLETPPWSEQKYLISSFFRDIANDVHRIKRGDDIAIPAPESYEGEKYFDPFAETLLRIVRRFRTESSIGVNVGWRPMGERRDEKRYSLVFSVLQISLPASRGMTVRLLWPEFIRVVNIAGVTKGGVVEKDGVDHREYVVEETRTLDPEEERNMISPNGPARFEYAIDNNTRIRMVRKKARLYWTLDSGDSNPLEGSRDIDETILPFEDEDFYDRKLRS